MHLEDSLGKDGILAAPPRWRSVSPGLRISDRTKAGLERARRSGKVLGRPDGFERWAPVLAGMREQEFSQGRMSRETGLSYNTVKKYLKRLPDG